VYASAAVQVVVRTPGRSYRVSQMAALLRDIGDSQLVSFGLFVLRLS
jgi:hypothetical protein